MTKASNSLAGGSEELDQPKDLKDPHPTNFTIITHKDIESGAWVPVDRSLRVRSVVCSCSSDDIIYIAFDRNTVQNTQPDLKRMAALC